MITTKQVDNVCYQSCWQCGDAKHRCVENISLLQLLLQLLLTLSSIELALFCVSEALLLPLADIVAASH